MVPYAVNPSLTGTSCSLKGRKDLSLSVVPLCVLRKHHVSCCAFFSILFDFGFVPKSRGCFVSQVFLVSFALPQSLLRPAADDDAAGCTCNVTFQCYHIGIAARPIAMQPHWQAMRHRTATCLLCCMLYEPRHSNSQHGPSRSTLSCSSKATLVQPVCPKCSISVSSILSWLS